VIFDVDWILVDSESAEEARQQRRWGDVYKMIPRLPPYPGVQELLKKLAARNVGVGIATGRPARYVELIVKRWGFPINARVCFGDFSCQSRAPSRRCSACGAWAPRRRTPFPSASSLPTSAGPRGRSLQRRRPVGHRPDRRGARGLSDAECASVEDLKALLTARFAL